MTVTIPKKNPSPADDTLTRHARNGPPLIGITNENQVCRFNDGSHTAVDRSKAVVSDPWPIHSPPGPMRKRIKTPTFSRTPHMFGTPSG
jgi:hypothetical protein